QLGAGQSENMYWMQPQGEEEQGPGYGVRGDRQPRCSQETALDSERRKHATIPPILIGTVDSWETMNLENQPSSLPTVDKAPAFCCRRSSTNSASLILIP